MRMWTTTTVSWLLFTTTTTTVYAATLPIQERNVLLEFYQATGGPKWKSNHGWAENRGDYCKWHGVICVGKEDDLQLDTFHNNRHLQSESEEYKILGLNLRDNNLVGRTTEQLYQLPLLKSLQLSSNPNLDVSFLGGQYASQLVQYKLHDTGVSSVNGLSAFSNTLESLHLSGPKIQDIAIPAQLFTLTNLKELHMATNKFQGSLPEDISKLTALQVLNVYNNNLSGTIPLGMSALTNMRVLTLTGNKLTGSIPGFIGEMRELRDLYLDGNQLNGALPSLSGLTNVKEVFMNYNYLSGTIPSDFLSSTTSSTLRIDLNGNRLSGTIPATLNTLKDKAVELTLADNLFTAIDSSLCSNTEWMENDDVKKHGCDAIVCPVGTFGTLGRRSSKHVCEKCTSALYVGQRYCLDSDDRGVLSALYTATNGKQWYNQDNWLTDADVCEWYGVTCWDTTDAKKGRVRHLNLDGNNLQGTIPQSIYALETLTTITVSRNKVVMRFDAIRQAPHMRKINVANTDTILFDGIENAHSFFAHLVADKLYIGGTIPSSILSLSNLETLSMSECHLKGTIPQDVGKMVNLQNLYLHGNELQGQIPTQFGNLVKLKVLSLAKNKLSGVIPSTIAQMTSLQALSLSDQVTKGGGISGNVPDFTDQTALQSLYLGGNKLEGTIPSELLRGVDLDAPVTVDLSSNVLTGTVPGALSRFVSLNLKTEDNFISGVDTRLCALDKWMNGNVREYGCDAILCPTLSYSSTGKRMFDSEECQACGDANGDANGAAFYGQTSCGKRDVVLKEREILQQLYDSTKGGSWHNNQNWYTNAHYCDWYGVTCDNAKSVVNIVLGSNKLQGNIPTVIYQLPNLSRLSLFSNNVDVSFDGIERARSLRSLILDSTGLTSLVGIGDARGLKELNVRYNALQGTIPSEVQRLVHLEAIEASDNNLSGPLPTWLGKLPGLDTLVLSKNKFSGPLPDFADLPALVFLDLSHNQFTGQVPTTLLGNSTVEDKIFVDLSNNRLSGTVPGDLKRLDRLQIHLSNNKITAMSEDLCSVNGWNDNDVEQYGCDGIMCPVGTYNVAGRQTADEGECSSCKVARYMGQTKCSGALRTLASVGAMATFVVSTLYLML